MEIELKLNFDAQTLPEIRSVLKARTHPPAGKTQHAITVYYDTPGLALSAAGFSLRVRKIGDTYRQTLKSLDVEGEIAVRRFEQEWDLKGEAPDLGLLDGTPAAAVIAPADWPRVGPIFATHIDRSLYAVELDDTAAIEVAVDTGEIRAGAAAMPVHELELELKHGPLAALYRFARELQAALPVTIAAESKAGRGFRLRSGCPPRAQKSRSIALAQDATTEAALRLIVESGLSQLIGNLAVVSLAGDGEGVHQARVAIRRLRSALVLFERTLEPHAAAPFERLLQHYGRIFGAARDWDVFVLETIPHASAAGMEEDWLSLLVPPAQALRREAHLAVNRLIAGRELTGFVLALAAWSTDESWFRAGACGRRIATAPLRDLAPDMLDRLEAKVRKRAHHIARQSAEELHGLRKTFKKLRYAVEFFSGLYDHKAVKRYRNACEDLQEILGAINDAVATEALVERIGELREGARLAPSIGILGRWTESHRTAALERLPAAWEAFRAEKPFWR